MIQYVYKAGGTAIGLAFLFLLFFSFGCSIITTGQLILPVDTPEAIRLENVPFFPQKKYECGPSSLAMALTWSGLAVTPDDLSSQVFTPDLHGSLQASLISGARQYGRVAYPIKGSQELVAELTAAHPVIVLQNLGLSWYPKWHYAVVIGYENGGRTVILHSGDKAAEQLSARVFQNTWARADYWGLLVLPTDELPATVTEERYILSVAGLERARQFDAAIRAYKTALRRWPESMPAWMGLGNSFYEKGDFPAAASAFKQAIKLQPGNGLPLNNLAQVYWDQGKKEEALQTIHHAIDLGGPFKHIFEETLQGFEQGEK